MSHGVVFKKRLSHRGILKLNQEQHKTNEELGVLNVYLSREHEIMRQERDQLREIARNALEHRFSPHTWYKALVLIRGEP